MLRINENEKKLVRLAESTLADSDHWERDFQEMICADPDAFCQEIGESLLIIGQEIQPSDAVSDRIDILALDEAGTAVVIELKRGTHKLQLLQALSYAGMVSKWAANRFVETRAAHSKQTHDEAQAELEQHIGPGIASINQAQRVILIAEDFDPALLVAAEWLHENFGVDIRCYRLQLSEEAGNDYLTCTCIYPPLEIATLSRGSDSKQGRAAMVWSSWDAALETIENAALKDFVRSEIARQQESQLQRRGVIYRIDGKRRFWVNCRRKYGYVWQTGRFDGDEGYWRKALSAPDRVRKVDADRSLRFFLITAADFSAFRKAVASDLLQVEFSDGPDAEPASDTE